ncbi:MAG: DUF4931 domain-containing protein [Selenomonadaceae bacterium]|nr:DUF4931 domain-containing protein [Selenomonadaceae bacterium]
MDINLIGFDVTLGRTKPENIIREEASCPFCDVEHLTDIIDTAEDGIILLKNKYNVIENADQFVIIEGSACRVDMPGYSKDHMRRLVRFGFRHWQRLIATGKYAAVIYFKNYGPMSGGTIRHPHMQLVGFRELNAGLMFSPREFEGLTIREEAGTILNVSTCPRVGFGELNIVPGEKINLSTVADFIQVAVDYLMHHFSSRCRSYNIFFYPQGDSFFVKVMPRFATSPLFIGYNIHFLPNNLEAVVEEVQRLYFTP